MFIELKDKKSKPILVNINRVTIIQDNVIQFDDGDTAEIKETLDDVKLKIDDKLKNKDPV